MSSFARGVLGRRSRLAVRIYLVGLVQFSLVAAGLVLVAHEGRHAGPSLQTLHVVADSIAASADDSVAVAGAVANAEKLLGTKLGLFDERHHLIAGSPFAPDTSQHGPPPSEWAVDGAPRPEPPPPFWDPLPLPFRGPPQEVPITLRDGRVWHLAVTAPHPLPSVLRGLGTTVALVLVVVGVSGWLTARGLVGPLARLSRAARAFGAGDLKARAALDRSDELGDVSAAFDEMAEQVTRALRAEKELLANVSHELRTPLQRIQIAIDLAAEGDAATARESLDEIAEDLAELGRIVEEVLAAARLSLRDGGNGAGALLPIHRAPTDLIALLHKSAARFHALHASRPIHVDVTAALPTILVDAVLVRRAMDNLLDNAHKYTDETDAPIMLSATREGETIAIEIRDTGIGISADDRARLFEPFFRADRSRARSTGGLGLGLLLAKRIVEAHGGTLTVKSVSRAGTTARIELPVEHVAVAS